MAEAVTLEMIQKGLCEEIETLLSLNAGAITPDTLLPGMGIDSLRFVSLMLAIEQRFGVDLMKGGLTLEEMKTVRALSAVIFARRNG
jgi:acyl carrier protein